MIKIVELYESIPAYPETIKLLKNDFAVEAPLCEDDDGSICYISEEARIEWIRKLRKAENNRKQKEFFKKNIKPGDLWERIGGKGTKWLYFAVEENGELKIKFYCKTKAGKLNYKQYVPLGGIPSDSKYLGIYAEDSLGGI